MRLHWRTMSMALIAVLALAVGMFGAIPARASSVSNGVGTSGFHLDTLAEMKARLQASGHANLDSPNLQLGTPVSLTTKPSGSDTYSTVFQKGAWGGYIDDTTNQTNVNGVYACYNANQAGGTNSLYGVWTGVGGYNKDAMGNSYLLQTGIDIVNGLGWAESVPGDGPHYFNIGMIYGDYICSYTDRTGPGAWETFVEDLTRNKSDLVSWNFSPEHTTAEAVLEFGNRGLENIAQLSTNENFDHVSMLDINNNQHNFAYASTVRDSELNNINGWADCLIPGGLVNDSTLISHFSVAWHSSGC